MFNSSKFEYKQSSYITTSQILERVSEYDILSYYFGKVEMSKPIKSPFRKDRTPSFVFFDKGDFIKFKDFGTGESGNLWQFLMRLNNWDYKALIFNLKRDFIENEVIPHKTIKVASREDLSIYSTIEVYTRDWNSRDDEFWGQYYITRDLLRAYDVYPLTGFWLNGIGYSPKALCYGYLIAKDVWKIYQPYSLYKWITNASGDSLQGFRRLPQNSDTLIITKSLKDVMVYNLLEYNAIAPQSENIVLDLDNLYLLEARFNRIIINYDFDLAGVKSTNQYKKLYNLGYFFFTNGRFNTYDYKAKDVSDLIKNRGIEETKELINKVINKTIKYAKEA
jgi:hypothetical protein